MIRGIQSLPSVLVKLQLSVCSGSFKLPWPTGSCSIIKLLLAHYVWRRRLVVIGCAWVGLEARLNKMKMCCGYTQCLMHAYFHSLLWRYDYIKTCQNDAHFSDIPSCLAAIGKSFCLWTLSHEPPISCFCFIYILFFIFLIVKATLIFLVKYYCYIGNV